MRRRVLLAVVTSLLAGLALAGLPAGQLSRVRAPATCAPVNRTVVGTGHTDQRAGAGRNDFMIGSRGDDVYWVAFGKDCLVMRTGNDRGQGPNLREKWSSSTRYHETGLPVTLP